MISGRGVARVKHAREHFGIRRAVEMGPAPLEPKWNQAAGV